MYLKVLKFHGLGQDLDHDDFYPTEAVEELEKDVMAYLESRPVRLVVLAGCVGAGKTTIVRRLAKRLEEGGEFLVAFMTHNDSSRIREAMVTGKLLRLLGEGGKKFVDEESKYEIILDKVDEHPQKIILIVDDAQGLRADTLVSLKKVTEKGISVLLAAHTQLAKKMERSMFEEVGLRAESFDVPGIAGEARGYLEFLLKKSGGKIGLFSEEAIDELSRLCQTPRQVRKLAWAALRRAVVNKEKQVSLKTLHEVFPTDFSHLWVELRRLGYTATEIAEEVMDDRRRVLQCLQGRLPEDDDLYKTIGVFLHGLGIRMGAAG